MLLVRPAAPTPSVRAIPAVMPPPADARRVAIPPTTVRERRRARPDRRVADRRAVNLGSPYGVERRSGHDDRLGDRRGGVRAAAGIGLTRDYFAQAEEREAPPAEAVPADLLVRFHD